MIHPVNTYRSKVLRPCAIFQYPIMFSFTLSEFLTLCQLQNFAVALTTFLITHFGLFLAEKSTTSLK